MKRIIAVLFLAAQVAHAGLICNKGCFEYNGSCACDIQPNTATPIQPSDEKPPKDKMPSYQREGIRVIELKSLAEEDAKQDQARAEADVQGKAVAGIR